MPDITSMAAAVAGLKTASDIIINIVNLKSATDVQAKVIELQQAIMSAQSSAMTAQSEQYDLMEKVRRLETELAELKAWEVEKARYQLKRVDPGVLIYELRADMLNGEPPHSICPTCYGKGVKSLLQCTGSGNGVAHWKCFTCQLEVQTGRYESRETTYRRTREGPWSA